MPELQSPRLLNQVVIERAGTELVLLPNKTVWWPGRRSLILADTHFGKASTFRRAGLPVPAGTTARMLQRLSDAIYAYQPQQLLIVGDFIHSQVSSGRDFEDDLHRWRGLHRSLELTLIQGNHDRRDHRFYQELDIRLESGTLRVDQLALCHDPAEAPTEGFSICGHLHPGHRLGSGDSVCLPCFLLSPDQLILPAFGEFTGRSRQHPHPTVTPEIAYLICDQMLAPVQLKPKG